MKYVDTPCGKAVMPESFEKEKGEGRFRRLKHTHPRQYDYCMGGGGVRLRRLLEAYERRTRNGSLHRRAKQDLRKGIY